MKKLEEIRARAEKATEGPWEVEGPNMPGPDDSLAVTTDGGVVAYVQPAVDDAEFIAHSRTDVPKLVSALEAVEAHHLPEWEVFFGGRSEVCRHDRHPWPCPTVRTIQEALQ